MFTLGRYPVHIEQTKGKQPKHKQKKSTTEIGKENTIKNNSRLDRKREKNKK